MLAIHCLWLKSSICGCLKNVTRIDDLNQLKYQLLKVDFGDCRCSDLFTLHSIDASPSNIKSQGFLSEQCRALIFKQSLFRKTVYKSNVFFKSIKTYLEKKIMRFYNEISNHLKFSWIRTEYFWPKNFFSRTVKYRRLIKKIHVFCDCVIYLSEIDDLSKA